MANRHRLSKTTKVVGGGDIPDSGGEIRKMNR